MKKLILISAVFLFALGCGTREYVPPDYSKNIWPNPPEKTRIQLLSIIYTDLDIRGSSTAETLFGQVARLSFKKPHDIAVGRNGTIFITDTYKKVVVTINIESGKVGELFNPRGWKNVGGLATDNVNGLIAATDASRVLLFSQDRGNLLRVIGKGDEFKRPMGLAFDSNKKILYIADTKRHYVYAYGFDGKRKKVIATPGTAKGKVYFPSNLAVDKDGFLYVVDTMNFRVQIFKPDGTFLRAFGEHGTLPGNFARPKGIAVSPDGFIFVTDGAYSNFQIFDKQGRVYLFVGSPGKGPRQFNLPQGIYVDKNNKVYVVDQTNRRIKIFQYSGD